MLSTPKARPIARIPHFYSAADIPDHTFFEKPVLQRQVGDQFLHIPYLTAQVPGFGRVRLARGVVGQALITGLKELFRPAEIQTLGNAFEPAQRGNALFAAQTLKDDPDLIFSRTLLCTSCTEYPAQPVQWALWLPRIFVSFPVPSVTTMSQKSSITKVPQPVP